MIKIRDFAEKLNVLYEDNHLLVVEKFRNVLSQQDSTNDIAMTQIVEEYLRVKYQKPGNVYVGLIHRLDRRVGGVMVFAKTSKAASRLSEDIRNHRFKKYYLAKVKGSLEEEGTIAVSLKKDEKTRMAVVDEEGKPSVLHYTIFGKDKESTYVLVDLETGRYNQIRASFAHINHPLWNDYKYDSSVEANRGELGLWSYQISFVHPTTKETLTFELAPKGPIWKLNIK